jgi:hypothetical protein
LLLSEGSPTPTPVQTNENKNSSSTSNSTDVSTLSKQTIETPSIQTNKEVQPHTNEENKETIETGRVLAQDINLDELSNFDFLDADGEKLSLDAGDAEERDMNDLAFEFQRLLSPGSSISNDGNHVHPFSDYNLIYRRE